MLLEDGVYTLPKGTFINVDLPGLTIRSASGNRAAVILNGAANNITISAPGVTIAGVTLRGASKHGIQIRGERGSSHTQFLMFILWIRGSNW